MVVMDIHSRKIIGFSIQKTACTGPTVCRMFNEILGKSGVIPKRISTDNDPLFQFHRWKANLRIAGIEEIKSVPGVPTSHPFVERVIGTTRRECLDQTLFWNEVDLGCKLSEFRHYYNEARVHYSLDGVPPEQFLNGKSPQQIDIKNYRWKKYCHGLYSMPVAA